jgi:tetratricopeptide (TPR) repeat protein
LPKQAELEISLRKKEEGKYAVEFRFRQPDSQVEVRLGQEQPVLARLDLVELYALSHDPVRYAKKLTEGLFTDPGGRALFSRARATATALKMPLRIQLSIAADAEELQSLYWETLLDPEDNHPLFTGENTSFSRYLSSQDWRPVQLPPKKSLKALVVVANPSDLPPEQTIDAPMELARAVQELGTIKNISMGIMDDSPPVTLENLAESLREYKPDILYLVCHGALSKGRPYLLLEDEQGLQDIVRGEELVGRLKELDRPPLLIVLASCQSAGRPGSAEARAALGPRLAEAGVSAVIAMQGDISQETVAEFMPVFFRALGKEGRLEYAMSLARGRVRERLDYWMPALFTRLEGDSIFAQRVIPWTSYTFVSLTVLLLATITGWIWYSRRIPPMGNGFNLAVAEFAVQDENGRYKSTEEGKQFSDALYRTMESEFTNINLPGALQVELRQPEKIGVVAGNTSDERMNNARKLAEKNNTTILVYGVIDRDEQGYKAEPAFYVNNLGFDYGGEVAGPLRLGLPLLVNLGSDVPSQFEQNTILNARIRALQNLVRGLSYFYIQQYDLAADFFQQAVDESAWKDNEGKEVAYTLLGAAWLRSFLVSSQDKTPIERARPPFETAVAINPQYARGYLGLGSVVIQQADRQSEQVGKQVAPLIWEGRDWLLTAQSAKDKPSTAFVDTKSAYELGLAQALGSRLGIQGLSAEEARRFFEQVLQDYDRYGQPAGLVWYADLARYYLGRLALKSNPNNALNSCQRSVDDLQRLNTRAPQVTLAIAYAWECVGMAQGILGHLEQAKGAYQKAINLGNDVVTPEVLNLWKSILEQLEKGVPVNATP